MIPSLKILLRPLLPKRIRAHSILSGQIKGSHIVTSWHDYPAAILGLTERPLLEWFKRNVQAGQTWLDIGAHYGYTAIALSRLVGVEGRVFAFEPMLSTSGCVAQTRRLNNFPRLTVVSYGLAAPETLEMISLPVTRGMVDSTSVKDEGRKDKGWLETIMVARFDWLWQRICGTDARIDGVKIDVQGMEVEVLTGMMDTLRSQHPKLVVELHRGVDRERFLHTIELAGYACDAIPVEPVAGEVSPLYIDDHSYFFHKPNEAGI
ncbi:FkbM family methyltransferase [Thermodesulfobacteriota bacterium]